MKKHLRNLLISVTFILLGFISCTEQEEDEPCIETVCYEPTGCIDYPCDLAP